MELPNLPVTNVVVDGLWEEQFGPYTAEQMQEYARQAVLIERDACAKLCENRKIDGQLVHSNAVLNCAAAIRART